MKIRTKVGGALLALATFGGIGAATALPAAAADTVRHYEAGCGFYKGTYTPTKVSIDWGLNGSLREPLNGGWYSSQSGRYISYVQFVYADARNSWISSWSTYPYNNSGWMRLNYQGDAYRDINQSPYMKITVRMSDNSECRATMGAPTS